MPPSIDRCIFCGGSPTNKEHVFSRWTHKYVQKQPGKYLSTQGQESRSSSEFIVVRGKGDIHDWQVKCVDAACNNGWMRERENKAMPILVPLLQGQQTILSPNDLRVIAGWAVLKAMIGEYETDKISWSDDDRERVRRIQLPPARDCFVWAATIDRGNWKPQWLCYAFPAFLGRMPRGTRAVNADFNSAACTLIIGRLLLHVVHGPLLRLIKRARYHLQDHPRVPVIWPVTGNQITWSATSISEREGFEIATGLYAAVSGNAPGVREAW